jgi:hypothetical protein
LLGQDAKEDGGMDPRLAAAAPRLVQLDALFARALALAKHACTEAKEIDFQLESIAGTGRYYSSFEDTLAECFEKEAVRFATATARFAERVLNTPAAPFVVDEKELVRAELMKVRQQRHGSQLEDAWASFMPSRMWARMASSYNQDELTGRAATRAARDLVFAFGLHRRPDIKQVRGLIELELSIKASKPWSGKGERYFDHIWSSDTFFPAWATFEAQALPESCHGLGKALIEELQKHTFGKEPVRSREKAVFHQHAELVYFFDCIKLYVAPIVADALNTFTAEFAGDVLRGNY